MLTWDEERGPLVDYPENPHGPLVARAIVEPSDDERRRLAAEPLEVVLAFDRGHSDRPLVLGVVGSPARVRDEPTDDDGDGDRVGLDSVDATIDGRRVRLEGHDEIELCCGRASITLRRNGRVVIRGTYVETRSQGTNRIRGATVEVN